MWKNSPDSKCTSLSENDRPNYVLLRWILLIINSITLFVIFLASIRLKPLFCCSFLYHLTKLSSCCFLEGSKILCRSLWWIFFLCRLSIKISYEIVSLTVSAYFTRLILNLHFYRRNNFVPVIGAVENLFNVESNVIRFKVKKYLARLTFLLQNCHKFSKRKMWFDL